MLSLFRTLLTILLAAAGGFLGAWLFAPYFHDPDDPSGRGIATWYGVIAGLALGSLAGGVMNALFRSR